MRSPRILVFAGSTRTGSLNGRLAALAAKELALLNVEVTLISLLDYALPLYDHDLASARGTPPNAVKLKRLIDAHRGIFITSPEYNASVTPLLKNTLDWISRARETPEHADPTAAYRYRIFALGAASNSDLGGYRSLMALRQILELGWGATVLPEQIAVSEAANAFDEMGNLRDERNAQKLRLVVGRLVELVQNFA